MGQKKIEIVKMVCDKLPSLYTMPGFITRAQMTEFFVDRLEQFPDLPTRREKCEVACEIFYYIHSNFQLFKLHFGSNMNFMNVIINKCHEMIEDPIVAQQCPNLVDVCTQVMIKVQPILLQDVEAMG